MKKAVLIIVVVAAVAAGAWYFLVYRDQAAQKQAVADMRNTGTAMFSWLTDQVGEDLRENQTNSISFAKLILATPANVPQATSSVDMDNYKKISVSELEKALVPQYLQEVPKTDGWGHEYEYYLDVENPLNQRVMAIRSLGRDGKGSGSVYQVSAFEPGSFDEDIVWADGFFVRWPEAK